MVNDVRSCRHDTLWRWHVKTCSLLLIVHVRPQETASAYPPPETDSYGSVIYNVVMTVGLGLTA